MWPKSLAGESLKSFTRWPDVSPCWRTSASNQRSVPTKPVPGLSTSIVKWRITISATRQYLRPKVSADLFLPFPSEWQQHLWSGKLKAHKMCMDGRWPWPRKKPVWINQIHYKQLVCSVVAQFYNDGGEPSSKGSQWKCKSQAQNSDSLLASLLKA